MSSVYDWDKLYDKLKVQKRQDRKRIEGGGRKSIIQNFETEIIHWIIDCRKLGICITTRSIIAFLYDTHPEVKEMNYHNLYKIILRFLKRNNLSIRKASHIGQPLPNIALECFYSFFHEVIKERRVLNIYDDDNSRLINCDETLIFLEMPETKTIDVTGNKGVIISTHGNEKKRISVLLSITGDGKKLEPYLVFKIKTGKNFDKNIQTNANIVKGDIYITTQKNSWVTAKLFCDWYEKVFLKNEKKIGKKCLLIFDKASSHINEEILEKLKKNDTHYVFIPGGLTRYLQPLDIGVNKILKNAIKNEYIKIEQNIVNKKRKLVDDEDINDIKLGERRHSIINIINKIWKDENIITKENIINSFYKSTITYKMDGSDDNNYVFPESLNELDSIYDNLEYLFTDINDK